MQHPYTHYCNGQNQKFEIVFPSMLFTKFSPLGLFSNLKKVCGKRFVNNEKMESG